MNILEELGMNYWKKGLAIVAISCAVLTTPLTGYTAGKTFSDVPASHPYYDMISDMTTQGIISGYEDGTFKPNEYITRQHAALLINNAVLLPKTIPFEGFPDVYTNHPYFLAMRSLQTAVKLSTDEHGNFQPEKPLTRGEMAKIIVTAFPNNFGGRVNYYFSDTKDTEYDHYVQLLYSNGITAGYEDGTFKPEEPLTRAHFALFMHRANNVDKNFVPEPIGNQKEQQPMPAELSKNIADYPSDRVVSAGVDPMPKIHLPNGELGSIKSTTLFNKEQKAKGEKAEKEVFDSVVKKRDEMSARGIRAYGPSGYSSGSYGREEDLEKLSELAHKTIPETRQILNYIYATGEVYQNEGFYIYATYNIGDIVSLAKPDRYRAAYNYGVFEVDIYE